MSEERSKPSPGYWIAVVIVVVFVVYPLSLFPIVWMENRGIIPDENNFIGRLFWAYCAPLRWLATTVHDLIKWASGN